jgi:hypothetical protein
MANKVDSEVFPYGVRGRQIGIHPWHITGHQVLLANTFNNKHVTLTYSESRSDLYSASFLLTDSPVYLDLRI